jgi:hypothetical protein
VPMLSLTGKTGLCTRVHYVGSNYNCVVYQESVISGERLNNDEIIDTCSHNPYFYVSVFVLLTKEV